MTKNNSDATGSAAPASGAASAAQMHLVFPYGGEIHHNGERLWSCGENGKTTIDASLKGVQISALEMFIDTAAEKIDAQLVGHKIIIEARHLKKLPVIANVHTLALRNCTELDDISGISARLLFLENTGVEEIPALAKNTKITVVGPYCIRFIHPEVPNGCLHGLSPLDICTLKINWLTDKMNWGNQTVSQEFIAGFDHLLETQQALAAQEAQHITSQRAVHPVVPPKGRENTP